VRFQYEGNKVSLAMKKGKIQVVNGIEEVAASPIVRVRIKK
jgi:hypothetical protein